MSWAPLLLIEQNHISATRASSQWKAWHIGLKQHLFFFFLKTVKYFSNIEEILRGSVNSTEHCVLLQSAKGLEQVIPFLCPVLP